MLQCTLMQDMPVGSDGPPTLVQPRLFSLKSTKQRAVLPKSEVLLLTSPTTTPGASLLLHHTLPEIRTTMKSFISLIWHRYWRPLATLLISSLTLVSLIFPATIYQQLTKLQARNGVQPTSQLAWGDWCNVINTGFGVRPTTNTGNALEDAFVWVKPGGECDVSFYAWDIGRTNVLTSYLGNFQLICRSLRLPLRSRRRTPALSPGWIMVPGLFRPTFGQCQPIFRSINTMTFVLNLEYYLLELCLKVVFFKNWASKCCHFLFNIHYSRKKLCIVYFMYIFIV